MLTRALAIIAILFQGVAVAGTNGIDTSFGVGGVVTIGTVPVTGLTIQISSLAAQADGKILVGGHIMAADVVTSLPAVGRLNSDGTWDTAFADHGLFVLPENVATAPNGGFVNHVVTMSDGSILATGGTHDASHYFVQACSLLIKLSATGTPDSTFGPNHSGSFCFDFAPSGTVVYSLRRHYEGVVVDADNSFFLTSPTTNMNNGAIAHFDSSGFPVASFGSNGIAPLPLFGTYLLLTPTHHILTLGVVPTPTNQSDGLAHMDSSGTLDPTFGTAGLYVFDTIDNGAQAPATAALDRSENILVAGNAGAGASDLPYRFYRVTSDGQADTTFNGEGQQPGAAGFAALSVEDDVTSDGVLAAMPLPDGHIFAVGQMSGSGEPNGGVSNVALIRLNEDSSWDQSFGDDNHPGLASVNLIGGPAHNYVQAFAEDLSNRVLIVSSCQFLLRLIPDRLFDSSFETATAFPACSP